MKTKIINIAAVKIIKNNNKQPEFKEEFVLNETRKPKNADIISNIVFNRFVN